MSWAPSVDVVGPSYWGYMAAVMADRLEKVLSRKRVDSEDIPRGVYRGAVEFFNLALEAVHEELQRNPPASVNAYVIAADAVRRSSHPIPKTREELKQRLEVYSSLVERLRDPGVLSAEDTEAASGLREFFIRLHQAGETEAYERQVRFEPPPIGFRYP